MPLIDSILEALETVKDALPPQVVEAIPFVGVPLNLNSCVTHGLQAYNQFRDYGKYHDPAWENTGHSTVYLTGAVASAVGVGIAVSGVRLAVWSYSKASGTDVSLGYLVGQGIKKIVV